MMVDTRFRHLPVMDEQGVVVGLLDIAKCLYDALSVLEKVHGTDASAPKADASAAAMAQVMNVALKKAGGGRSTNQAQLLAMQALMEQLFGGSVPTVRSILGEGAVRSVLPTATVTEASKLMAEMRKGVLVMDPANQGQKLLGIITPKDLLNRVIAKNLSPDETLVADVMTPNPDCVTGDLTLIDALREMYEHKYLHLPVREEDGRVIGIVDVMELVCSTAGGGGGKGWRDFFSGAMAARGDGDDHSDTSSNHSHGASARSKTGTTTSANTQNTNNTKKKEFERPVSKLRPKAPITALDSDTILEVAKKMAGSRVDAALLLDADGALSGIITDNDVTRRLISQSIGASQTLASAIMTKNP
jgi:CBS domain-containing protein